jgi:uncharacterized protein YbbC (DUF1343 family)
MKPLSLFKFIPLIILVVSCASMDQTVVVQTGLDRITEYHHLFQGKNIGIITNHTAYNKNDYHIIDIFLEMPGVKVVALFGPEHGIRGKEAAGDLINDQIDSATKIPIYSLYGKIRKPTPDMLQGIDVLVFDIQDIGARFYTYIYTMSLAMEAAAENNVKFVVLDRPNPINGISVEGNILESKYATFVGLYPIPVRHGMTVGELARLFNEQGWFQNKVKVDLTIIEMQGWNREMWYDQTGLKWRSPSPNMPDLNVATVYPGMCLFEGTHISEGRGTYRPFLQIGAPWLNAKSFDRINEIIDSPGVYFESVTFVPKSIPSMSPNPKYLGIKLYGISIMIKDRSKLNAYLTGIALVKYFYDLNRDSFEWRISHFDRLCGSDKIRKFIQEGKTVSEIERWINYDLQQFLELRTKYLLY